MFLFFIDRCASSIPSACAKASANRLPGNLNPIFDHLSPLPAGTAGKGGLGFVGELYTRLA
jgi:hypothetical protein